MSQKERDDMTNDFSRFYDLAIMAATGGGEPSPEQVKGAIDAGFRIVSRVLHDLNRMADAAERQAEAMDGIRKRTGTP